MISEALRKEKRRVKILASSLCFALVAIALFSMMRGAVSIYWMDVLSIIKDKIVFKPIFGMQEAIVWDIRLPRVLSSLLIGCGLGMSGTVFQSILRNPLADPYTIGVSTGSAFGAVLVIFLNITFGWYLPTVPFAFACALMTLFIIMKISGHNGILHSTRIILAGIIVSAILSAGISFIKNLAGEDVSAIVYWLMGRMSSKSWADLRVLLIFLPPLFMYSIRYAGDLDLLALGIHEAESLGIDAKKRMRIYLIVASLITAVCVSTSGIIGFVGLVIPHLLRIGVTSKHRYLIPLSGLGGGVILLLADTIARLAFKVEMPVGVLTTLIGGPFFVYIFIKKKGVEVI